MSHKYSYITPSIFFIGSMISIWFLISNLQPLKPALCAFIICVILGIYLFIKMLNNNLLIKVKKRVLDITKRKYFVAITLAVLTLIGLLIRLYFYIRFSYIPTSDPMTFYDSAKTLATVGSLVGNGYGSYVAFQPYLSAYNNILGLAMRIIQNAWLATILINTFFDILSSLTIFILLKKILKPGSQVPVIAFGVWILNPLNIIFSVISLPIIIVNFFVVLTILVSYLLLQETVKLNTKKALLISVVLALIIGLGNCFRPIFIVPIIALIITSILVSLNANKSAKFLKLSFVCITLVLVIFTVIQIVNLVFVSKQTGLSAAKNPSGWSMYVGSSWETNGEWRPYHNDDMYRLCEDSLKQNDFDKCHNELRNKAIERYKSYGVLKFTNLLIQKLYHQAEEQDYFYNAEHSIVGYSTSRTFKIINAYMVIYMIALFLFSAKSLYSLAKKSTLNKHINPILLFMTLIMIGWFFSFVSVESAPRYSTILYPLFIVFSMLMLEKNTQNSSVIK